MKENIGLILQEKNLLIWLGLGKKNMVSSLIYPDNILQYIKSVVKSSKKPLFNYMEEVYYIELKEM